MIVVKDHIGVNKPIIEQQQEIGMIDAIDIDVLTFSIEVNVYPHS